MPTPSEAELPLSPQSDVARTPFTTCPPEDERVLQDGTDATPEDAIAQQPTPEPDERRPTLIDGGTNMKSDQIDDGNMSSECHHSGSSDAETPGAQSIPVSMSNMDHSSPSFFGRERARPGMTTSFLHPGSRFHGTQRSDRQVYDVQVEIKDVDISESFLCGYLRIQGLTDDHPTLTTFFEGEIIGPKHLFKTTNPTWGSTEKVDLQHWARFPAWRPLAKSAKSPNFTLKNYQQREHLFMRWKEYFLVPDHRVKTITGASFEGFYYICFNQCDGSVSGIYFHAKSEKYQQLELSHVDDRGCMPAMEFR